MKFIKQPVNFETEKWNYLVIGYYRGKAIVKNELSRLFFIRCEENEAPIGTAVAENLVEPIEKLSSEEQEKIQEIYGNVDD